MKSVPLGVLKARFALIAVTLLTIGAISLGAGGGGWGNPTPQPRSVALRTALHVALQNPPPAP